MRTPFDTSKTSNRKEVTPRQYLQKFQKKSWRHNASVDIHNPNLKTKTKVRKNLKIQKSWGGDIPSIPTKPNFWEKSKEATFSRYLHPNPRGSNIPSILAIPFNREATLSRYLHFWKPKTWLSRQNPAFMQKTRLSRQNPAFLHKSSVFYFWRESQVFGFQNASID